MEINWLGNSCFRLKGKQCTIITDPFTGEPDSGLSKLKADVVCLSHLSPEESGADRIGGQPYIVRGPGEYEVCNTLIIGIPTYQDEAKGSVRGKNTVYALEIDELSVCHLGNLGHLLDDDQVETIGNVDILFVPVGGSVVINAAQAAKLVRTLEPKIVIPMTYRTQTGGGELDPLEKFLTETGSQAGEAVPKLNVTKNSLPLTTQVVILESLLP